MLCRLATVNNNLYARRGQRPSWSDIEAETTALMSGTNHTNMPYYNKTDLTKPCSKCAYENEMIARKIDRYARIIFPSTFAIFCAAYWFYYSWWDVEN